jgi:hypothetical protein
MRKRPTDYIQEHHSIADATRRQSTGATICNIRPTTTAIAFAAAFHRSFPDGYNKPNTTATLAKLSTAIATSSSTGTAAPAKLLRSVHV